MKMKTIGQAVLLLAALNLGACATPSETAESAESAVSSKETGVVLEETVTDEASQLHYFTYDAMKEGFASARSDVLTPTFYIFAGQKTEEEAEALLAEIGLLPDVQEWAGQAYVINPLHEGGYQEDDAEAFIKLLAKAPVKNAKVIALDEGATFVNNFMREESYPIAGMMLYGGDIESASASSTPVPVYISNAAEAVADSYIAANAAEELPEEDDLAVYRNPEKALQQVVVNEEEETVQEAYANAWEHVFSKNYRMHNEQTEFYMADVSKYTDPYPLIGIPNFEELGITYNQMIAEPVKGEGEFNWYEYIPETAMEQPSGSVPLIVTLHGFANDPRLQGDTSGWTELAAEENLIVVSPEWQAKEENFGDVEGFGEEGVLNLIEDLKAKYPQIDPSRIYLTGLSAGGSKATLMGVKYPGVFAAVAAVSSPGVDKQELTAIAENYFGPEVPYLYIAGDHDNFQMIPVDGSGQFGTPGIFQNDPNVDMFPFIQAYQKINRLEVSERYDMSLNEFYGVALDNQGWTALGDKQMLVGTDSNANGAIMKLAAVKDLAHWNYKPEAAFIWDFFQDYQRNTENGQLIMNTPAE
ncbi:alpha/beta hydrolase family esterase [Trichococcus ilyis]|uniref:Esterase phb depolymerase n=1 Tax=Trichococcus ilyis TaxID=640938 RepID=A0A143YW59_9LACT|nr:PHB depolymerase family esterase [Trichococcus ilyis]CZR00225.1 esterase phb depolymerase [Trichococcus ilyis]CZR06836.1 esterase phb depolymerase [Trichococcus ilyis]SEJ96994.1 Poly(3-hydroxybutyrate) depolymerase [Trichococcus ilyis]